MIKSEEDVMRTFLFAALLLPLSGCPDPECERNCPATYERTWGVQMAIDVQPGVKASGAEVEVTITRPRYDDSYYTSPAETSRHVVNNTEVEEGDEPYDEEIELKLHWSCPTLEKSGQLTVTIKEESATSTVKIGDLPPQPHLTVYPWEFKRGLECILMTEDEKIAQEEEEEAKQNKKSSDKDDEDIDDEDIDDEEEAEDKYRGERAFFIKKPAPEVKLSQVAMVAGTPDSYADIKVELLRNDVAVVAGDRSFDWEVEVKLPWTCENKDISPPLSFKSGDTHIVIPAGASSGEARLIMPVQQSVRLICVFDAQAYIDSYPIGNNVNSLEFKIPAAE